MADRWGWQGCGRSAMPYNVFSSTVKTQIQFSWGSVARMAVISFFSLPLFFFCLSLSSCFFYKNEEGPSPLLISPPLQLVCLSLLLSEVKESPVLLFEWACSRYVNLPCLGTSHSGSGPWLWCHLSAERALCLKCLDNYNVYDACVCSVNRYPHHTYQEKAGWGGFVERLWMEHMIIRLFKQETIPLPPRMWRKTQTPHLQSP